MPTLADLKAFDVAKATLSLWVFKKSGLAYQAPSFNGRWVETTDELNSVLKAAVSAERARIEEVQEYDLLAQNNEGSALSITTLETHAGRFLEQSAAETSQKKATKLKEMQNSTFYVIKLVWKDGIIYAVRKTDASWRARKALTIISAFFADEQLGLDKSPGFEISKRVDFFIIGNGILIRNKQNFESILNYKQAHKEDFAALRAEPEFIAIFTDLAPLSGHVGENKIQLRRVSAIRQKGHYRDEKFMANLRERHSEFGLDLQFDDAGRIMATPDTCRDIFIALLDHRLASGFSRNIYDVPDATHVIV